MTHSRGRTGDDENVMYDGYESRCGRARAAARTSTGRRGPCMRRRRGSCAWLGFARTLCNVSDRLPTCQKRRRLPSRVPGVCMPWEAGARVCRVGSARAYRQRAGRHLGPPAERRPWRARACCFAPMRASRRDARRRSRRSWTRQRTRTRAPHHVLRAPVLCHPASTTHSAPPTVPQTVPQRCSARRATVPEQPGSRAAGQERNAGSLQVQAATALDGAALRLWTRAVSCSPPSTSQALKTSLSRPGHTMSQRPPRAPAPTPG